MASPCDLVSVAQTQSWLGQTSDGPALAALASQVSRAILSYLGRPAVLPTLYSQTHEADGHAEWTLAQWPVCAVTQMTLDGRPVPPASEAASGGLGYWVEPADPAPPGRMQTLALHPAGVVRRGARVAITYVAGYEIAREPALVPEAPGPFAVSPVAPFGAWACDRGVSYAGGGPLLAVSSNPLQGQYAVDAAGAYAFNAADAGAAVFLSYGYVPFDLAQAAMEWTAERYAYKSRIALRSKSLGGQETASYDLGAIPAFVQQILQPYRRVAHPC
jgi:hypothetical protein